MENGSRLCHFIPGKRDVGTQYIGCVKRATCLEILEKIKVPCPCWGWTYYSPVFSPAEKIDVKAILNVFYQFIIDLLPCIVKTALDRRL